jgi:S-adenosyl-L-methionine hydrolase (adenosine-forming)
MNTISFLTDFGHADEFVGVCKAVIRQLAPGTTVLDIAHDLPVHDVRAGSLALVRSIQYLPDGVILAIVDPGVGTARKAVAVEAGERAEYVFVGPDNGLLAPAVAMVGGARRAVVLTNDVHHLASPGGTFAGRDIFSPVAALLSAGIALEEFGDAIDPASLLPGVLPLTRVEDGAVLGEVLWVDRYGNVQLNIDPDEVEGMGDVLTLIHGERSRTASRCRSYADIKAGSIGIVVDSYGLLSLCVDRFSAARELGLAAGSAVSLRAAE